MNFRILISIVVIVFAVTGCNNSNKEAHKHVHVDGDIVLCGKCGDVKGTDTCCKSDVRCGCGFIKGTAACCKTEHTGEDMTLCGCGQVKGTDLCCTDQEKCSKCDKHKGSPGCCLHVHSHG